MPAGARRRRLTLLEELEQAADDAIAAAEAGDSVALLSAYTRFTEIVAGLGELRFCQAAADWSEHRCSQIISAGIVARMELTRQARKALRN